MSKFESRFMRLFEKFFSFVTWRELRMERDYYKYLSEKYDKSPQFQERLAEFRAFEIEYRTGDREAVWEEVQELYRLEPALRYEVHYLEVSRKCEENPSSCWVPNRDAARTRRIVAEAELHLPGGNNRGKVNPQTLDDDPASGSRRV